MAVKPAAKTALELCTLVADVIDRDCHCGNPPVAQHMTSTNTEVLHRRAESWIVIQFTNVISHQSQSPCSHCLCLWMHFLRGVPTGLHARIKRREWSCLHHVESTSFISAGLPTFLPIILCGKFKPNRIYPRSGWEKKVCMWEPEEEHGKRQGFWKHLRESWMLTECFKVFWKWIRVSGAQGPSLPGLTVSALMVANKSVRGDWQGAGCKTYLPHFSLLPFLSHFLLPVAAARALVLRQQPPERAKPP